MEIEVAQSIQQTTYDQFHKLIKEQAANNKSEIVKTIKTILESSLNTFSDFLTIEAIDEVRE
jgi:uncharacterized protein (DUF2267 family)